MTHKSFPKPEKRRTTKRRKARAEAVVVKRVRGLCIGRDGYCRVALDIRLPFSLSILGCAGQSEWSHFGTKRRARTLGQEPEERHTTAGTLMLCRKHHRKYDAGLFLIGATTDGGCDGPLSYGWSC